MSEQDHAPELPQAWQMNRNCGHLLFLPSLPSGIPLLVYTASRENSAEGKAFLSFPSFMGGHWSPLCSRPRGRMQKLLTMVAEPFAYIQEREKRPTASGSPLFRTAGIVYDACFYFIIYLPCLSTRPTPLSWSWDVRMRCQDASTQVVGWLWTSGRVHQVAGWLWRLRSLSSG